MTPRTPRKHRSYPHQRPIRCTHPQCGKYGHTTSQCWVAHPKLRPYGATNRGSCGGLGRGWDDLPSEANDVAYGTPSWDDDWSGDRGASSPRSQSPLYAPFPFLKLPQELQDKVYKFVYEEQHGVVVFMSPRMESFEGVQYYEAGPTSEIVVQGHDYGGLGLVCKKMRADSRKAQRRSFNGRMRVVWDEENYDRAFSKICAPTWSSLRYRITELDISGLSSRTVDSGFDTVRRMILMYFPCLSQINICYNAYRYKFVERDNPYLLTPEWLRVNEETYPNAFAAGEMDNEFAYPADVLGVYELVRLTQLAPQPCTIFLNTNVRWLNGRGCREFSQHVKFLVTADQLEAVERGSALGV
ncbi:hypothetical protein FOPE_01190 [Fonsecaea pedrosoi]|nr:hypothetical protein FOPE_01190 [Fonsecaea pedrosoi]